MTHPSELDLEYIDSTGMLERACEQLDGQPYIAVDTEFVREKSYYPVLCLIQIASPQYCACIDPITIRDLTPLADVLKNKQVTKVFHAARQDIEVLQQTFGSIPEPIFDTQIGATLLGLGDQVGYANLVKHFLNVQLAKGHARTDWEQRPLSREQLEYAADDVRYLIAMYPLMIEALTSMKRLDWLDEDFKTLSNPLLYQNVPQQQWQRVSGVQKLKGVQLAILQQLAEWRELQAQEQNKPRKWIVSDDILIAITMQAPQKQDQLERIRGLNSAIVKRHGQAILKMVAQASSQPKSDWPVLSRRKPLKPNQEAIVEALLAVVKLQASTHQINHSALTSRHDIEALLTGESDIPLLHGWRKSIAGQYVLNFLQGQTTLAINNQGLLISKQA